MMFVPETLLHRRSCCVMGIVNATGDSFSEGAASSPDSAVERGMKLAQAGADCIDIGGESTRPGSSEVSPQEECARILPVLEQLKKALPDMIFSIDTRHAQTAEAALKAGAHIINDVSMGRFEPEILNVTAKFQAGLILNHSRGTPETMKAPEFCSYPDGVRITVERELLDAAEKAQKSGVAKERIFLDPGIGFAKTPEQCHELVREAGFFTRKYPWVWGISRKRFLGGDVNSRSAVTLNLEKELARSGASVLRTHDAAALVHALETEC